MVVGWARAICFLLNTINLRKIKMQILKTITLKTKTTIAIALILMFVTSSFMIAIPKAQAIDLPTYIIASVSPDTVGVGQPIYINAFMTKPNVGAAMGNAGTRYNGLSMVVTKPSGTKDIDGPRVADATGGIWQTYIPTEVGNYTLQAFYLGENVTGSSTYKYLPSESAVLKFTITAEPRQSPSTPALPTEYWSRPIISTNFLWAQQLGSNWWGLSAPSFSTTGGYDAQGNVQPYGQAPNSAHILWTKPTSFGGQPGGEINADQQSQFTSSSILKSHFNPIIVYGILIYTEWPTATNPSGIGEPTMWKAVDLRTGELLWERNRGITNNENIIWGQIQKFHTMQEYGSYAVFWSSGSGNMLYVYDVFTGAHMANVTNAPSPPMLGSLTGIVDSWDYDSLGAIIRWYTSGTDLICWNSSKIFISSISGQQNYTSGIEWTINMTKTYPTGTPTSISSTVINDPTTGDGVLLMRSAPTAVQYCSAGYQVTAGINIKTGALLWGPLNQTLPLYRDITFLDADEGVYVLHDKDTNEAYGYSLSNGLPLWGPVKLQGNSFSPLERGGEIAYGQIYIWDFGGFVHALDLQTGKINWVFTRGSAGYETPYGIWPIWHFGSQSIGDGKLFLSESRMYDPPMSPGYHRLAINTTTGELVWKIQSFSGRAPGAIADSMLVQWNSYDKQLYTYGQGQTATTIVASPEVSVEGNSVLIKGMVTDESPGTKNTNRIARFPNGVPAVSEESQEDWMEYVYMQQPRPTNSTGVPVSLSVIDSNGNNRQIGTATSDASGMFGFTWKPDIQGQYTVIATFAGSQSYYGSSAQTYFVVDSAAATPAPTAEPVQSTADMYFVPAIAGLFVFVAIIGVILALLVLRKRP
jgi:hypothetical protein